MIKIDCRCYFSNSFFVRKLFGENFNRCIELNFASTPGESIYDEKIQ